MKICDPVLCTGCGACQNICPNGSITMQEDQFGMLYPQVNEFGCVGCKLCQKVCPQNEKRQLVLPKVCYASYRKEFEARLDSASGGVAAVLYEVALANWGKDGWVYGVCFDANLSAFYTGTQLENDLKRYKGSKYVHAYVNEVYQDVAAKLEENKHVLFIGTPCQVAGCIAYLDAKNIPTQYLITVDLLCHGVSPQRYLIEEIEYLKKRHRWAKVTGISFRSNRKEKNYHFVLRVIKGDLRQKKLLCLKNDQDGKVKEYNKPAYADPYFFGFLKGITLRESCYNCSYACQERIGDLTIGDFIGLAKQLSSSYYEGPTENVSMILVNSDKGKALLDQCSDKLVLYTRPFEEAYQGGISLQRPFPRHELTEIFRAEYCKIGFMRAMRKLCGDELILNSLKGMVKAEIKRIASAVGVDLSKVKSMLKRYV